MYNCCIKIITVIIIIMIIRVTKNITVARGDIKPRLNARMTSFWFAV